MNEPFRMPLMERGDVAEVRLEHGRTIEVQVSTDGTALMLTAGPGWLMEDPLGNRIYTTEFIVVPRVASS